MVKKSKTEIDPSIFSQHDNSDMEFPLNLLPEKDRDLLNKLGVKNMEDFDAMLRIAGIDPEKALKSASNNNSLKDFIMSDIYFDSDDPRRAFMDDSFLDDESFLEDNDEDFYDDDNDDVPFNPFDCLPHEIVATPFLQRDVVKEYHLRIKLCNSPVKIWRELKLPSNMSLELLAFFFIDAMGWENNHLHQFRKGDKLYVSRFEIEKGLFGFYRNYDANNYSIDDVLHKKGDKIEFEYDFGDSWTHEVWVKEIRDYEPHEKPHAELVKGHGTCPPEDCGGVWGYAELLQLREKKRKSADDKERLKWYYMDEPDFDPDFFDVDLENEFIQDLWDVFVKPEK